MAAAAIADRVRITATAVPPPAQQRTRVGASTQSSVLSPCGQRFGPHRTATLTIVTLWASVIIPVLNEAESIATQLDALAQQDVDAPWEVIVVDNGSTDDTVRVCTSFSSSLPIRVVVCEQPGTSAARNRGAAAAGSDRLLFCDADDKVAPGWVRAMVTALEHHDAAGGAIENDLLNGERPAHMPRHPDHLPVVAGFLPRAISANLAVRRGAFEQVGGFAEDYTYGSDDTEFCWRLQLAGFDLGYASDAVVHYRHRSTLHSVAVKAYKANQSRGRLFRDYGAQGMPQPRLIGAAARWGRLVIWAPVVPFSPRVRWWWAEQAAGAAGRISGSLRHRVVYL